MADDKTHDYDERLRRIRAAVNELTLAYLADTYPSVDPEPYKLTLRKAICTAMQVSSNDGAMKKVLDQLESENEGAKKERADRLLELERLDIAKRADAKTPNDTED